MKTGIYKITNQINGKFYIGSSKDLSRRKKYHFRLLKKGINHSILLQRAVNKYGLDNFIFEVIAECSEELLFTIEQKLVDYSNIIHRWECMRYVPIHYEKFSASRYLDEIKTDKFNSKDKLRDPTLTLKPKQLYNSYNWGSKTRGC